jgi:Protein of unknown function (DUF1761)
MDRLDDTSRGGRATFAVILAAGAAAAFSAPEWVRTGAQPLEMLAEFARCLVITFVLAQLLVRARVQSWKAALFLGAALCAFQAVILLGSLIHEHMPPEAYGVRAAYAASSTLVAVAVLGLCRVFARDRRNEKATVGGIHYKALLVAAVAAIVVGGLWYSPLLFGGAWARLKVGASAGGAKMSPVEGFGELVRSGIVAYLLARLINFYRIGWRGSLLLGAALWLGFHATLLLYSVIHEHMPLALFEIHAGHGLANDLVIATIVGAWRSPQGIGSAGEASTGAATTHRALQG